MPVLNLALSNSALAREVIYDEFDGNMKSLNIMASLRTMAETMEAYVVGAPIPTPTHTASLDVVDAISAVDAPYTAIVDAVTSSVAVVVVDACINAYVYVSVANTSRIASKTHARAFYIVMRICACFH